MFQEWGVDGIMGVLTQHGYQAAQRMGHYQGQKYASDGLELDACSDMFVYCEEVRRRETFKAHLSRVHLEAMSKQRDPRFCHACLSRSVLYSVRLGSCPCAPDDPLERLLV